MRKRSLFALGSAVVAAGAATFAYASLVERNLFTLRRFDVPVLEPDAEPLRILHISDLHMMPEQRRKQAWVAALAGLDPDLVVTTGDNMADPESLPGVLRALDPLLSVPGAFVFGSNDYRGPRWKNPLLYLLPDREYVQGEADLPADDLRAALTDAGWADLNNARTVLKAGGRSIELVGVDDPHVNRDVYSSVAGPISTDVDVHLGVTHTPASRVLNAMSGDGFELLLAGHTHGGQVCVPFYGALTTNCDLPTSMAKGLHRWPGSDSWLHVSAGLGTHPTAPIRFSCRPEASILTLIPR
ncbi:metallophosphoesterase [Actinoplanes solisilvae]|uniref:metallophosphoesterase n=1 Tax=Actinoplanes solisilvae TaxID=2486853 RepID=UPI000FD89D8F|nr:metallophosphoesterase [Actinoplanes solisilvae]